MTETILSVQDLNVYYGSIHALKGINFEVKKGEVVSLIGANGAGKTTTLRAISGIVESKGQILFKGQSLSGVESYNRVTLGLAQSPEGRGVFPQMTILENLMMGAYFRSDKHEIEKDIEMSFGLFPRL